MGQGAAVEVLVHALANDRVGHAYLFSGPRGCGKTSVARILAKALNCASPSGAEPCGACPNCLAITAGESLDVVEIDGASNNSVDEVRELKSHVTLAPFSSKYKVYIIDEVHMLSTAAFNALLKTLEEPPSYVVFILATTEPHKVPVTIRSRCQHIPFRSIGAKLIAEQLQRVCDWEKVAARPEALWEVARQADGAMRDALSMLEQVINRASGEVTLEDVEATLGAGSRPALERWLKGVREEDGSTCTGMRAMMEGASPQRIFEELFSLARNLWLASRWPDIVDALDVSEQEAAYLREEAPRWNAGDLRRMLESLVRLITQARLGLRSDVLVGMFLLDLMAPAAPRTPVQPRTASAPAFSMPTAPQPATPAAEAIEETAPPPEASPAEPERPSAARRSPTSRPAPAPLQSAELPSLDWQPLSDEAREALLAPVKEADFTLYCGLLDAVPSAAEDSLLLDAGHRYCYEVLRLERNAAALARLLPQFQGGLFLRCEGEVFVCPREQEPEASREAKSRRAPAPAKKPDEPDRAPSDARPPEPSPGPGALPFDGLIKEVSRLMRGEVVLVRHELDGAARDEQDDGNDEGAALSEGHDEGDDA